MPGNTLVFAPKSKHPYKLYGNKKRLSTGKLEFTVSLVDFHMNLKRRFQKSIPDTLNFLDYHYGLLSWHEQHKFRVFIEHYVIWSQCDSDKRNIDLRPFSSPLKTWIKKKKRKIQFPKVTLALSVFLIISFAISPSKYSLLSEIRHDLFLIVLTFTFEFFVREIIKYLQR